jgi:hypothetical protein
MLCIKIIAVCSEDSYITLKCTVKPERKISECSKLGLHKVNTGIIGLADWTS